MSPLFDERRSLWTFCLCRATSLHVVALHNVRRSQRIPEISGAVTDLCGATFTLQSFFLLYT